MLNSTAGLLEQLNTRTHLHLKLSTDTTQEWQDWIDIVVLELFQLSNKII